MAMTPHDGESVPNRHDCAKILGSWSENRSRIYREITQTQSSTILILQTWIPAADDIFRPLVEALSGNERIEKLNVALASVWTDTGNQLLDSIAAIRSRYRDDILPASASPDEDRGRGAIDEVKKSARWFISVRDTVNQNRARRHLPLMELDFRFYDCIPFGPLVRFDDCIFFGLYPVNVSSSQGPIIEIHRGQDLFKVIDESASRTWELASTPAFPEFMTRTLWRSSIGPQISTLIHSAIRSVRPADSVASAVTMEGDELKIAQPPSALSAQSQQEFSIKSNGFEKLFVLSIGKAAVGLAHGIANVVGRRLSSGMVITKKFDLTSPSLLGSLAGSLPAPFGTPNYADHPDPTAGSQSMARDIRKFLGEIKNSDLLIVLISGGASTMFVDPIPGISVADIEVAARQMRNAGKIVEEVNSMRILSDRMKGGGLLDFTEARHIVSLVMSDIVNDPVQFIASGPTTIPKKGDISPARVLQTMRESKVSSELCRKFESAWSQHNKEVNSPPSHQGKALSSFVIASVKIATHAVARASTRPMAPKLHQINPYILTTSLRGDAYESGKLFAEVGRAYILGEKPPPSSFCTSVPSEIRFPFCLICGGEPTVKADNMRANSKGGRALEFAIGAAEVIRGLPNAYVVAIATDGDDGTSGRGGAVVSGETMDEWDRRSISIKEILEQHRSFDAFKEIDDAINCGQTGTNVGDVYLFVGVKKAVGSMFGGSP